MYLRSAEANSREKTSTKSEYSIEIEMEALFTTNIAIYALQEG